MKARSWPLSHHHACSSLTAGGQEGRPGAGGGAGPGQVGGAAAGDEEAVGGQQPARGPVHLVQEPQRPRHLPGAGDQPRRVPEGRPHLQRRRRGPGQGCPGPDTIDQTVIMKTRMSVPTVDKIFRSFTFFCTSLHFPWLLHTPHSSSPYVWEQRAPGLQPLLVLEPKMSVHSIQKTITIS